MDEATRKACDRIEKLMRLAGKNPNPQEAASALAKAQDLLLAYNLDMSVVEAASGQESKRTDESSSGGGYEYQRNLWRHIAELNLCMYWTQKVRVKPGSYAEKRHRTWTSEHRLVGRVVNVQQTKNMAGYLHQTIERLRRERLGSDTRSREAMAYREGIADRIVQKLRDRRRDAVEAEEARAEEAARKAAAAGHSLSTVVTVATIKQQEDDANYDFIHGEGASAKRRKRIMDARQAQAEAEAEVEKYWAEWAEAHPEEAAKEAKEEAARDRANERRRARSGGGWGRTRFADTPKEIRQRSGMYHHGYEDGKNVGIDPQAEDRTQRKIGSK